MNPDKIKIVNTKGNRILIFYLISFLITVFFLSFIRPTADDWGYFTTPRFSLSWSDLLPQGSYWRPLDVLYGRILGYFPEAFPYLNHALVALGHFLSIYFLGLILKRLDIDKLSRIVAVIFFAISPGITATLYSVDSINQSWALAFGTLATAIYLGGNGSLHKIGWIILSCLAVLSKESGIVWFLVPPFLGFIVNTNSYSEIYLGRPSFTRLLRNLGAGIVFISLYFFFRVIVFANYDGFDNSNPETRYRLTFLSYGLLKNLVLLFSSAFTSIDSAAILLNPPRYPIAVLTVALNIPFVSVLLYLFVKKIRAGQSFRLLSILVILIIASAPHLFIAQSAEMHGYPTVFFASIVVALLLNGINWKSIMTVSVVLYFMSAIISDVHKYNLMYRYGKSGERIAKTLVSKTTVNPSSVLLIIVDDTSSGYSVFYQNPLMAFDFGGATKPYYRWKYPKQISSIQIQNQSEYFVKQEIDKITTRDLSLFNCVWIINGDEISVINNN